MAFGWLMSEGGQLLFIDQSGLLKRPPYTQIAHQPLSRRGYPAICNYLDTFHDDSSNGLTGRVYARTRIMQVRIYIDVGHRSNESVPDEDGGILRPAGRSGD